MPSSVYAKYYFDLRSLAEANNLSFPLEPLSRDRAYKLEVSKTPFRLPIVKYIGGLGISVPFLPSLPRYSHEILVYHEPDFHNGCVYALSIHGCGDSFLPSLLHTLPCFPFLFSCSCLYWPCGSTHKFYNYCVHSLGLFIYLVS